MPYNTNNENPAHGLDMISGRQRIETLNFNDNKSQKNTHGYSHLYRPLNFRGQRAHVPKFSRPRARDQSDWRKYLESIRHETVQKGTRV